MKKSMLLGLSAPVVLSLVLAAVAGASAKSAQVKPVAITVYKTPTCGCCAKWVDHMKHAGFAPAVNDLPDLGPIKTKAGVPANLQSCHTAMVDGYVVEGHVPADVVQQLLKERPKVTGIAVPGMPMGSPGMEQGGMKDPYDVVTFDAAGRTKVYAKR